jgi:hypothetical protein
MGKKSGSGMNNPDHISEILEIETIIGIKILKLFDGSGIRDGKNSDPGWNNSDTGYGINIPDPQHCENLMKFLDKSSVHRWFYEPLRMGPYKS